MKRSAHTRQSSSESTSIPDSSTTLSPRKRLRSSTTTDREESPIKVFIVQEKLNSNSVHELFNLIDKPSTSKLNLEICSSPQDADVIVTNIKMKKRFQRHVNWDIARQKSIVTPEWIYASVKENHPVECKAYAALSELTDETTKHCPEVAGSSQGQTIDSGSQLEAPTLGKTHPRVLKNWTSRFACARASPLICPNQALAIELGILGKSRELEGKSVNALSYERSVAIIKSYPYVITEETYKRDIVDLPGLGSKTLSKIREFLQNGYIPESRTTRLSERFQALSAFTTIYGIGPSNARTLYDQGLRTLEDMERYYDVTPEQTLESLDAPIYTPNGRRIPSTSTNQEKGKGNNARMPDLSIQVSLLLRHEFEVPIPRDEAEEMQRVVMRELGEIQPGCISTIVGGYRRGKSQSNDVDIIISHPDTKNGANIIKGLCKKLTRHLYARGMVTHCMQLSGFHAHDALRNDHWDSLEKALTVFKLPPVPPTRKESASSKGKAKEKQQQQDPRLHRRLDLIFAIPEAYWTAVVGWSGSKMFERDLRLWAKVEKGMKFDSSGMTRRHDSKLFVPRSEQEVFSILGLDWVDPTMRNADV